MIRQTRTRAGFTLVEILVAIALGIVLLGIAVGVSQSSAFASYKVVGAADRLSQWMLTAKSRALRDKAPRGIRLLPDPTNANLIKEIAYIEQPEPWVPTPPSANPSATPANKLPRLVVQRIVTQSPAPAGTTVGDQNTRVFLINIPDPTGIIQSGDTLFLPEIGQSYVIGTPVLNPSSSATDANPAPQPGTSQWPPPPTPPANANVTWQNDSVVELPISAAGAVDLGSRFGAGYGQMQPPSLIVAATYHTTNFAVFRQPRLILGEPTQLLPIGMAVDLAASLNAPPAVGGNRDILFAPSGEIIGVADGVVALVLRDTALAPNVALNNQASLNAAGQIILVCTYPRTGAISTQPNNPAPAVLPPNFDAFQFAKDGINTGL